MTRTIGVATGKISKAAMLRCDLSARRDVAAAKAPFHKAIKRQECPPRTITLDGYAASHHAAREMKADGALSSYLNNLIEQDHNLRSLRLEVGSGNDWHGRDYTKAAVRAVQDAIHHSSLTLLRTLGVDPSGMVVDVTIGVHRPEQVDRSAVAAALPEGRVAVDVVPGGLDIPNSGPEDITVIATAAIVVHLDLG